MEIFGTALKPFAGLQSLLNAAPAKAGRADEPGRSVRLAQEPDFADALRNLSAADQRDLSPRSLPTSIRAFSPAAFDDSFRGSFKGSMLSETASMREETSLSFELTTREGDVVSFEFRQADFMSLSADQNGFDGEAGFERLVSMSVAGDLSDEERVAIDNMIAKVAEQASSLFEGDLGDAALRLASLGFESDALAAFSLDFRQTSYQSITRVYGQEGYGQGAESMAGLADLAGRDSAVAGLLEGIASMQRQLIEDAKALFAPLDAARFGRSVVPAVLGFAERPGVVS